MSDRPTAADAGAPLTERDEQQIEAWEKKRAAEVTSERTEDLSDDAESGGP